jgi:hypothetical protein
MSDATVHLDMEPRASDFIELLRDLGHLDDATMERLTDSILEARNASAPPMVTYDEVRLAAATLLFDAESTMRPESRDLLGAEWNRLFA